MCWEEPEDVLFLYTGYSSLQFDLFQIRKGIIEYLHVKISVNSHMITTQSVYKEMRCRGYFNLLFLKIN